MAKSGDQTVNHILMLISKLNGVSDDQEARIIEGISNAREARVTERDKTVVEPSEDEIQFSTD